MDFTVAKTFNKYEPGDKVSLPNELVGPAEVEKLILDGHIVAVLPPVKAKAKIVAAPEPAKPKAKVIAKHK